MSGLSVADRLTFGVCCLALAALTGCGDDAPLQRSPARVQAVTVEPTDYAPVVTLTGEIKARVQSDLSFRVGGQVTERNVDVGDHVMPDQPLARLDPQEQLANIAAAEASVRSAEAQLRQVSSTFERQQILLAQGFTTRASYDQAEQSFRTAQGSLDAAQAQLALARDQLSYTVLRAGVAGIITARNVETGQVMQAAQTAFTIAQDGPRDAVFNVYESLFTREQIDSTIDIVLISDPAIKAKGTVREVSPSIDPATGTVRVKIGIVPTPPTMTLGASVTGTGRFKSRKLVVLPWSVMSSRDGKPAVWVVDGKTNTVSLRPVVIESYRTGEVAIADGLSPGEIVVSAGAQQLRPNQIVAIAEGPR